MFIRLNNQYILIIFCEFTHFSVFIFCTFRRAISNKIVSIVMEVGHISCVYPFNRDIDDRDILEFLDLPWTKEMKYFLRTHTSQDRPKFIKNTASETTFFVTFNVLRTLSSQL